MKIYDFKGMILIEKIKSLIAQGEGLKVEFKEAKGGFPQCVYETICAFSNTQGGEILLGVSDDGKITGISKEKIPQMTRDFVNTINNSSKFHPPLYLSMEEVEIDQKSLLYILVPKSSEVHFCCNKIYVRNDDADLDITHQPRQIAQLYVNKDTSYSENYVYPGIQLSDLRMDVIEKCRKMAINRQPDHPWKDLSNRQLLESAGLYRKDYSSQKEGYTLACALLFGKDELIQSIVPHYKTDLILRINDTERYDDRDDVRTNLIDSYDRIMNFVTKYLPSPFFLDGSVRKDLRGILFREIAVNLLIHREYTNHYPAKLIIEREKIITENGNKPYICGNINPDNSTPYPKNPTIARFFKEIGWAEELGSGIRKIAKYAKIYAGYEPILIDGDIFKLDWKINLFGKTSEIDMIPVKNTGINQVSDQVSDQVKLILDFCAEPRSLMDIISKTDYKNRTYFLKRILNPMLQEGLLQRTNPTSPHAPNQKYVATKHNTQSSI